jgi:hypothetical protein
MRFKIDLTKPLIQLEFIFSEYKISLSLLHECKIKGDKVIVFSQEDGKLIEYLKVNKNNKILIDDMEIDGEFKMDDEPSFFEMIEDIEELELPVVLELDSILEKVSKYGRNSLTMEEFEYLHKF